jgi:hypothetical protein
MQHTRRCAACINRSPEPCAGVAGDTHSSTHACLHPLVLERSTLPGGQLQHPHMQPHEEALTPADHR